MPRKHQTSTFRRHCIARTSVYLQPIWQLWAIAQQVHSAGHRPEHNIGVIPTRPEGVSKVQFSERRFSDRHNWHALKGQKHIAQGNALGFSWGITHAPCKGKSICKQLIINAFALTGRREIWLQSFPRALPWAMCFWAFSPSFAYKRKFTGQQYIQN